MKWLNAILGGHPVFFDDVHFLPQYIVICQIFFPYIVEERRPYPVPCGLDGGAPKRIITYLGQWLEPILVPVIFEVNDIIHQLHHLIGYGSLGKFPVFQTGNRFDFYSGVGGEYFVGR